MTEQDWYSYLRLAPDAPTSEIEHAVERLSRQAAALETTAPERSRALREDIRSIKRDLLSGQENRLRHDAARRRDHTQPGTPTAAAPVAPTTAGSPLPASPSPAMPARPAGSGTGGRLLRFLRTGWTCPSCGTGAVPGDKFCTKCGTPINAIHPDMTGSPDSPLPLACKTCANPLAEMDVFCSRCGTHR